MGVNQICLNFVFNYFIEQFQTSRNAFGRGRYGARCDAWCEVPCGFGHPVRYLASGGLRGKHTTTEASTPSSSPLAWRLWPPTAPDGGGRWLMMKGEGSAL